MLHTYHILYVTHIYRILHILPTVSASPSNPLFTLTKCKSARLEKSASKAATLGLKVWAATAEDDEGLEKHYVMLSVTPSFV
jgi:hypothetical protein